MSLEVPFTKWVSEARKVSSFSCVLLLRWIDLVISVVLFCIPRLIHALHCTLHAFCRAVDGLVVEFCFDGCWCSCCCACSGLMDSVMAPLRGVYRGPPRCWFGKKTSYIIISYRACFILIQMSGCGWGMSLESMVLQSFDGFTC